MVTIKLNEEYSIAVYGPNLYQLNNTLSGTRVNSYTKLTDAIDSAAILVLGKSNKEMTLSEYLRAFQTTKNELVEGVIDYETY